MRISVKPLNCIIVDFVHITYNFCKKGGSPVDEKIVESPDTKRRVRVPPGQYAVEDLPVLHLGYIPEVSQKSWSLRLWGLVQKEKTLSFEEFLSLPRIKVYSDIHCVTGWSKLDCLWEGVSALLLKELVGILPEARFALVHSADGYSTNLALKDLFQEDVLLATHLNGKILMREYGGPVKLVVPRLYFWKSAKWVTGVEFLEGETLGYWESRGYHPHGDPWKEERYG